MFDRKENLFLSLWLEWGCKSRYFIGYDGSHKEEGWSMVVKSNEEASLFSQCINYGQRKAMLSVAVAATLRQAAPGIGGQGWDQLSRPYGRLEASVGRSRCVFRGCGSEIRSVVFSLNEGKS